MIYTRWGSEVRLTAYNGKHQEPGFRYPMMLVTVQHVDDGRESHQYVHTLRADGGLEEIEGIVEALPEVTLKGAALNKALKEAM